jgi:hypothetical protein
MKLNNILIKKLIKEAIADRIKMIDEAGDIAALEAKINKVEEDIKDAMEVKTSVTNMAGLKYYVSPEIVDDMMEDMEVSIKELQTKKKDLEDQKKAMAKNTKGPKKSEKKEDKEELKENNITSPDSKKVEDAIKSGKIKPEEVKAAAEKAIKGDSTDLALMMAGFGKMAEIKDLDERKLTTKQSNKKEDVVKSMKKSFKGPKSDMYAIATSVAKKSK